MARTKQGLKAVEERFAQLVAQGWNYTDAIKQVKRFKKDATKSDIYYAASTMGNKPNVKLRVAELLDAASLEALDNIPKWYERTLRLIDEAREAGNLNAASQLQRQLGQAIGAIGAEVGNVNNILVASNTSDEQLIQQLSRGNEADAAVLRRLLAPNSFDAKPLRTNG